MNELHTICRALNSSNTIQSAALATLVHVEGSSYRRPGARLLLTADGRRVGSVSGGCLEDDLVVRAQRVLADGLPAIVRYDTTTENDLVWGVGLGCHGVVHVLIEKLVSPSAWVAALLENCRQRKATELAVVWEGPKGTRLGTCLAGDLPPLPTGKILRQTIPPPIELLIFGAGDDVQPLVRSAKGLGWQVTVVDSRPAYATPQRFPEADATLVSRPEEIPARLFLDRGTLAVIMTHHYRHDLPLLRQLLPRPLAYLGLLGPKQRAEKILATLATEGFAITPGMRSRLHAPVGLDLGAESPAEIALSILAEMQAVLAGREGRPLRERTDPIHG